MPLQRRNRILNSKIASLADFQENCRTQPKGRVRSNMKELIIFGVMTKRDEFTNDPEDSLNGTHFDFFKKRPSDKTIWVVVDGRATANAFTFDKVKIYSLYRDYKKLSPEEKAIFDSENPFLANLLND